jgi:hypothetical protein
MPTPPFFFGETLEHGPLVKILPYTLGGLCLCTACVAFLRYLFRLPKRSTVHLETTLAMIWQGGNLVIVHIGVF